MDEGKINTDLIWGNDFVAARVGGKIAKMLGLKKESGVYNTKWGKKTNKGLARAVVTILEENS